MTRRLCLALVLLLSETLFACGDSGGSGGGDGDGDGSLDGSMGDGDGDGDSVAGGDGDGDGAASGDGDGDGATGPTACAADYPMFGLDSPARYVPLGDTDDDGNASELPVVTDDSVTELVVEGCQATLLLKEGTGVDFDVYRAQLPAVFTKIQSEVLDAEAIVHTARVDDALFGLAKPSVGGTYEVLFRMAADGAVTELALDNTPDAERQTVRGFAAFDDGVFLMADDVDSGDFTGKLSLDDALAGNDFAVSPRLGGVGASVSVRFGDDALAGWSYGASTAVAVHERVCVDAFISAGAGDLDTCLAATQPTFQVTTTTEGEHMIAQYWMARVDPSEIKFFVPGGSGDLVVAHTAEPDVHSFFAMEGVAFIASGDGDDTSTQIVRVTGITDGGTPEVTVLPAPPFRSRAVAMWSDGEVLLVAYAIGAVSRQVVLHGLLLP